MAVGIDDRAATAPDDAAPVAEFAAVIVTYGTPTATQEAVASLLDQTAPPAAIVVVDNGASEARPVERARFGESCRIEVPRENVGYGAGCNIGARVVPPTEFILFLNADVSLRSDACERMLQATRRRDRVAVVGPKTLSQGHLEPSARSFPTLATSVLGRRSALTRALSRLGMAPPALLHARRGASYVDWVSGACLLVRRSAFEEVGGFDEGYWMYWEDADLCRRLADREWRVVFEPLALVEHQGAASGTGARTIRAFHASAARYAERHVVRSTPERLLARAALGARARTVVSAHALRAWMRHDPTRLA